MSIAAAEAAVAAAEDAGVMSDSILSRYGFDDLESLLWVVRNAENRYFRAFLGENYAWYRQSNAGAWLRDAESTMARRYPINQYFADDGPSVIDKLFDPRAPGVLGGIMRASGWVARWMGRNIMPYAGAAEGLYAAYEHGLHTPSNTQHPYNPTPTTPVGPAAAPNQDIITGSADLGHSFLGAQSMPFATASDGGRFGGGARFKSGYPANQSRRKTEEFGDLNAHNRVFQFYNYHGEKKQMLDEYCRGLILSLLRIQKGTVLDYEEPIAWPYPVYHGDTSVPVDDIETAAALKPGMDIHLDYIEFHFKDNRRGTGHFGQTLSSSPSSRLPIQYRADYDALGLRTTVQLWKDVPGTNDPNSPDRAMKSLQELAADMSDMFQEWAYLGDDYVRPELTTIDDLDFVPIRVMLIKRTEVNTAAGDRLQTYDVVYDDDQLGSSRVDVGVHTTVTLHNVSPATGDIVSNPDPLTADTINHVPLVGKMYTFSGPVPKVWDKHRDDLHELFNPDFFKIGRYRLPKSKLENLEEFKSPPRGRAIWSNCIGENRIMIGPGQIKKLRMNFRVRCSFAEFWQKYRNQYLADTKMGRCVCLCLEPMIRRQHVGEPISRQLLKTIDETGAPIQNFIDVPPYEFLLPADPLGKPTKVLRKLFSFAPIPGATAPPYQGVQFWYHKYKYSNDGWRLDKIAPANHQYFDVNGVPMYPGAVVDASTHTPFTSACFQAIAQHGLIDPTDYDPVTDSCPEIWGHPGNDTGSLDANNNPIPPNTVGVWPVPWTAHVSGTAIGDPMMFNVQINRLLTGRTWLKKKHILGADKSGIKRKWSERLIGNLGSVAMFNDDGTLNPQYKADAPRDIDMLPGAGVPAIIPQGEEGNISVQATGTGGAGLTQAEAKNAFVQALTDATVLQHHGHTTHPLASVINNNKLQVDHATHPLAGVTIAAGKLQVDTGAVTVANPVSTVTVANPVNTVTVANPVNTVTVANPVNTVTVANPVTTVGLATGTTVGINNHPLANISATNPVPIEMGQTLAGVPLTVPVVNAAGTTLDTAEQNPVTSVGVTGTVAVAEQNPISLPTVQDVNIKQVHGDDVVAPDPGISTYLGGRLPINIASKGHPVNIGNQPALDESLVYPQDNTRTYDGGAGTGGGTQFVNPTVGVSGTVDTNTKQIGGNDVSVGHYSTSAGTVAKITLNQGAGYHKLVYPES